MATVEQIREAATQHLNDGELFLIDVRECAPQSFEVVVDSDTSADLDACATLNRAINDAFGDEEDFELTVLSAGVGQPLRQLRQYVKLIGSEIEVVRSDGHKLIATLTGATDSTIAVSYSERVTEEGKKRKVLVTREESIPLDQTRSVCEHLTFK